MDRSTKAIWESFPSKRAAPDQTLQGGLGHGSDAAQADHTPATPAVPVVTDAGILAAS
jgi:hypothetical protein